MSEDDVNKNSIASPSASADGTAQQPQVTSNPPTANVDDIGSVQINPYVDADANKEQEAVETRSQRLSNNMLEKKVEYQSTLFGFILLVIISLYVLFILAAIYLLLSQLPFHQNFPITGLIFLGMLSSVPTLLYAFLMVGLFSNKDGGKEEKSTISDLSACTKIFAELVRALSHK